VTPLTKPVTRRSDVALDGSFGPDREKRIVITLHPGGVIELRPERTRRAETIHLVDVYRYAVRCRVGRGQLEKARQRKEKKAIRLAQQRQQRAERKLFGK
jgi:hypothetical protein